MLWINGKPDQNDALTVDDGLWFGLGVFETIRVHDRPLFWAQHIQRLNAGLKALQVREALAADELLASVLALGIKNCVLKIAVTPDNILFSTRPLPADNSASYTLLPVDNLRSRNPLLLSTKNLNYLENLLARGQAAANGYDDALYVEKDGTLSETSRANIFFYKDGRLKTPDLACGILPGIVRQWVIEQVPVETGIWTLNDLLTAEAVLVTNSVIGVRPVTRIGGQVCPVSSLALDLCHRYIYAATSQSD
jgi:4-amino-4-deoxychorismate lyase